MAGMSPLLWTRVSYPDQTFKAIMKAIFPSRSAVTSSTWSTFRAVSVCSTIPPPSTSAMSSRLKRRFLLSSIPTLARLSRLSVTSSTGESPSSKLFLHSYTAAALRLTKTPRDHLRTRLCGEISNQCFHRCSPVKRVVRAARPVQAPDRRYIPRLLFQVQDHIQEQSFLLLDHHPGDVYVHDKIKRLVKVDYVDFEQEDCDRNPVVAYVQHPFSNQHYSNISKDFYPSTPSLLMRRCDAIQGL